MGKAFDSIKRGLLQAVEHAEGHAPQPEKQRFASVWDALADTPQEAARMKARSALRMAQPSAGQRKADELIKLLEGGTGVVRKIKNPPPLDQP